MAQKRHRLNLSYSDAALKSLDQIWDWNAANYGPAHADQYVGFLRSAVDRLATEYAVGRPVPNRPALKYISIRRRRKGHGHVAVYRVTADAVHVLDFFHTAQDWPKQV